MAIHEETTRTIMMEIHRAAMCTARVMLAGVRLVTAEEEARGLFCAEVWRELIYSRCIGGCDANSGGGGSATKFACGHMLSRPRGRVKEWGQGEEMVNEW